MGLKSSKWKRKWLALAGGTLHCFSSEQDNAIIVRPDESVKVVKNGNSYNSEKNKDHTSILCASITALEEGVYYGRSCLIIRYTKEDKDSTVNTPHVVVTSHGVGTSTTMSSPVPRTTNRTPTTTRITPTRRSLSSPSFSPFKVPGRIHTGRKTECIWHLDYSDISMAEKSTWLRRLLRNCPQLVTALRAATRRKQQGRGVGVGVGAGKK